MAFSLGATALTSTQAMLCKAGARLLDGKFKFQLPIKNDYRTAVPNEVW
jgi:hypothetical protein